jgi:lysophospholipase L1-like esterase
MKTIVCFGDSNTWGHIPGSDGQRYPREVRWPARLATALAGRAEVISEGLSGRTSTIESPVAEGRNGLPYLVPCLRSHAPVDILVIFLGTNDAYWLEPLVVAMSIGRLVKAARAAEAGPDRGAPQIIVVCPPPFGGHELAPSYREICNALGCELIDLDGIAPYSPIDDTHLDETGHIAVADAVEARIRPLLG